ncbi:MAG: hypothetical protein OEZ44_06275, partial [Candidatus Bathyarchaeota archaeon]|nr:hypothetical protein [Candidatus Bathyarchaeota archaeon]
MEAGRLAGLLEEHDDLAGASVERRLSSIREMREVEVVRVRVARLEDYRRVLAQVEALPCVAGVYDADVEHELK